MLACPRLEQVLEGGDCREPIVYVPGPDVAEGSMPFGTATALNPPALCADLPLSKVSPFQDSELQATVGEC